MNTDLCPGSDQPPEVVRPVRGRGPLREHGRCSHCHKWLHVRHTGGLALHYAERSKPVRRPVESHDYGFPA